MPQTATYDYLDENGVLLYQSVRIEERDGKTFRQRRPDGRDGWIWRMAGVRWIPYRLPQLLESAALNRMVFIVEGEKCADAIAGLGGVATTNPMGAGKWRKEFGEYFKGRHCFILPDNDAPGEKHGVDVLRKLKGYAASRKIVTLPDLPPKGDICDWLAVPGNDKVRLLEICKGVKK